jgi:hypothetical protein
VAFCTSAPQRLAAEVPETMRNYCKQKLNKKHFLLCCCHILIKFAAANISGPWRRLHLTRSQGAWPGPAPG